MRQLKQEEIRAMEGWRKAYAEFTEIPLEEAPAVELNYTGQFSIKLPGYAPFSFSLEELRRSAQHFRDQKRRWDNDERNNKQQGSGPSEHSDVETSGHDEVQDPDQGV